MDRFQAVTNIRECAPHDDAHRVIEIGLAHLVFEIDGQNFAGNFAHKELEIVPYGTRQRRGSPMSIETPFDAAEVAKFDALSHRFWDPEGEFKPLHNLNPLRAEFIAERARLTNARVLDVGCGGGLLAESLAKRGARMTAIDRAAGMIEVARLHAAASGLDIDYRLQPAEELAEREPAAFDVVTCMEMLEHVPNPGATIDTLAQLVKPGGMMFLSTINRDWRAFLLAIVGAEYVAGLVPKGTHEYERLIRPAEIAAWARAAGLELLELAGLEYNPLTHTATLVKQPKVNYLCALRKPAA